MRFNQSLYWLSILCIFVGWELACSPASPQNHNNTVNTPDASVPHGGQAPQLDLSGGKFGACLKGGKLPGRVLNATECKCIVALDGRSFSPGTDLSKAPTSNPDPRLKDPQYAFWTKQILSTHCGCCHNRAYKGAGTPYWDVGYAPVWWDSVSDRRLLIFSDASNKPGQTLPFSAEEMTKFRTFIKGEIARREKARKPSKP